AEIRVAAVYDLVTVVEEPEQLLKDAFGDLPGGNHQPERAGRGELLFQLGERGRRARLDVGVVGMHLVPALPQPLGHARAHASEADHPELHQIRTRTILRPRSRSERKSPSACARIKIGSASW